MAEPKLEIIPKKYSGESTVISMRISKAMLADIDQTSKKRIVGATPLRLRAAALQRLAP